MLYGETPHSHNKGYELSDDIVKPRLQHLPPHNNQSHRQLDHIRSPSTHDPLLCPRCNHLSGCSSFLRPPREACIIHYHICHGLYCRLWNPPSGRVEWCALLWVLLGRDGAVCLRGIATGLVAEQLPAVWEEDGSIRPPIDGGKCKRDHGTFCKLLLGLVGSVTNLVQIYLSQDSPR